MAQGRQGTRTAAEQLKREASQRTGKQVGLMILVAVVVGIVAPVAYVIVQNHYSEDNKQAAEFRRIRDVVNSYPPERRKLLVEILTQDIFQDQSQDEAESPGH